MFIKMNMLTTDLVMGKLTDGRNWLSSLESLPCDRTFYYSDDIMSMMASQITGVLIVCSTVCSSADQRKRQSSMSLAFVWGIHRCLMDSLHKGPVTRKMFPFHDVIMHINGYGQTAATPLLTAVTPLLTHWSYCSLVLIHWYHSYQSLQDGQSWHPSNSFSKITTKEIMTSMPYVLSAKKQLLWQQSIGLPIIPGNRGNHISGTGLLT